MGLIRGVARTAVVAGTATAVSNRVSRRQEGRWAAQDAAAAQPVAEAPPQMVYATPAPLPPPPMPSPADDIDTQLAQLKELTLLKEQGVLTYEEFEAQKRKILGT